MSDIFSKIFGVILAFVLSILTPYTITTMVDDMVARRSIMNEMTMFIDEVIDTGEVTEEQLADFQLGCNSYGPIVQIEVKRYVKTIDPDVVNGGTYTTYVLGDDNRHYNQGDHVQVTVHTIGYTGAQRLVMATVGILTPKFECTLSGRVR